MKRAYLLSLLMGILACQPQIKKEPEFIRSLQYGLEIKSWGMPGSKQFQVRYSNIPNRRLAEERFLYVIHQSSNAGTLLWDTTRIEMSSIELDSIALYAQEYLNEFQVDNRVPLGVPIERIEEGLSFSIAFEHGGKQLEATQYHVAGFEAAAPSMGKLMRIINSKLPQPLTVD